MFRITRVAACLAAGIIFCVQANSANLTLGATGRVSVELLFAGAAFRNTISLTSPGAAIAFTGCKLEPSAGLGGLIILSENNSQRGCRVDLDADPGTAGIQPFASGTVLEFNMCAQIDADAACDFIWSSDPADNSDGEDHVITTPLFAAEFPGQFFRLNWEDLENLGDRDFDDLVVVVRVQQDTDGDGLWDDWEEFGIDTNGDGVADITLLNADPDHKDVYLELDYMGCSAAGGDCPTGDTHDHAPPSSVTDAVIAAFAASPVTNPDGVNGIDLHIDVDDQIAHQTFLSIGCGFSGAGIGVFNDAKTANFGANNPRRFAYHYGIFGHRQASTTLSSGCGEFPGNDFLVTLGDWNTFCITRGADGTLDTAQSGDDVTDGRSIFAGPDLVCNSTAMGDDSQLVAVGSSPIMDRDGDGIDDRSRGTVQQQAGTLMHEFGHNLDLGHGGDENKNFKPNYISIMNYAFQLRGLAPTDPDGGGPLAARVDYSVADLANLNENNLNENAGVGDAANNTRWTCPPAVGGTANGPASGGIDWTCDGDTTDMGVVQDINNDGVFDVLTGWDDWDGIRYDFQATRDFEDGTHTTTVDLIEVDTIIGLTPVADAGPVADGDPETPGEVYACDLGGLVSLDGSGSFDANGEIVAYDWDFPGFGGLPATASGPTPDYDCSFNVGPISSILTVTDEDDLMVTDNGAINISVNAGPDQTLECTSFDGAVATLGANLPNNLVLSYLWRNEDSEDIGSTSSVSPTVPLGTHSFEVEVTDMRGEQGSDTVNVTVEDTTPPDIEALNADPASLTPPNHKMRMVTITPTVTDVCDAAPICAITGIASNEADNGNGDGNTTGDAEITGPLTALLRAERLGPGAGRIYTLTVECTDASSNSSSDTVEVTVAHDKGRRK